MTTTTRKRKIVSRARPFTSLIGRGSEGLRGIGGGEGRGGEGPESKTILRVAYRSQSRVTGIPLTGVKFCLG